MRLATLLRGGTVVIIDGFQIEPLLAAVANHRIGWLVLIPGMIDAFTEALRSQRTVLKGICALRCDGGPGAARGDRGRDRAIAGALSQ